jgi:hypothetical protein
MEAFRRIPPFLLATRRSKYRGSVVSAVAFEKSCKTTGFFCNILQQLPAPGFADFLPFRILKSLVFSVKFNGIMIMESKVDSLGTLSIIPISIETAS